MEILYDFVDEEKGLHFTILKIESGCLLEKGAVLLCILKKVHMKLR